MNKKLLSAALVVTVISSVGKILGLVRESALASYFGMSRDTDAFKIAFSIPDILVSILCVSILQVFVPIYTDILKEKKPERTKKFLDTIYTFVGLAAIVMASLGIIFCRQLINVIAPGFESETINKTVILAFIILPGTFFYVMGNLTASYLQIHGRFIVSSLIWFSYNVCIIVSLVFFSGFGIKCVAAGALVGLVGMLLIQLPSLKKEGFSYNFSLDFRDKGLRQIGISIVPVVIASAFSQIYNIINRMMASGLDAGSISAMDFAYKVAMLVYGVFVVSLVTVIYPSMADKSDNSEEFKKNISSNLSIGGIIVLPLVTLVYILRVPVIRVLFQRGSFSEADTAITAGILGFTVFGIVGITYREILNRAFYSLKDTKTPMINGIIAITLNIILNLSLVRAMGINGLALGTAISSFISAGMLFLRLNNKIGGIKQGVISDCFIKPLFASMIMGAVILLSDSFLKSFINTQEGLVISLIRMSLYSMFGVLVYIFVILQFNIAEVNLFKEKLLTKLNNKGYLLGVKND